LADDRGEQALGQALAAVLAGDHEVGDLVVRGRLEADEVGERELVEPPLRGVVAGGLREVDVPGDLRVPQVVVPTGEEEDRALAPTDEDRRQELAGGGVDPAREDEPVAGRAPQVGDAVRRDDLALDALDHRGGEVAAAVGLRVLERAAEHRRDPAGDRRDGAGDDAELEAVVQADVRRRREVARALVADVRAAQDVGRDEPVPRVEVDGPVVHHRRGSRAPTGAVCTDPWTWA
jgi:hypothetical protein